MYSGSVDSEGTCSGSSSEEGNLFGALTTFVMTTDSLSLELSESLRLRDGVLKWKD